MTSGHWCCVLMTSLFSLPIPSGSEVFYIYIHIGSSWWRVTMILLCFIGPWMRTQLRWRTFRSNQPLLYTWEVRSFDFFSNRRMTCFGSYCNLFSVNGKNGKLTLLTWFQDGYWREKLKVDHVFNITQRQRNYFTLTKYLSFVKMPWYSSMSLKVKYFQKVTYSMWSDPTSQSIR